MWGFTESHTPHMIYDITTLVRHAAERKLEIEQNKMKRIEVKYASYLAIGKITRQLYRHLTNTTCPIVCQVLDKLTKLTIQYEVS